jgi:hypothetical protein
MVKFSERLVIGTAFVIFAFGVLETIIGTLVYNFTSNIKIGAWYVGVSAILTSLIGFSAKRSTAFVALYPIMCVVTATMALVGALIDGIGHAVIGYLKACGNNGVDYWGDSGFYDHVADACSLPADSRDCYCVISKSSVCYSYDGNGKDTFDQDDCNPVIHEYAVIKILYKMYTIKDKNIVLIIVAFVYF